MSTANFLLPLRSPQIIILSSDTFFLDITPWPWQWNTKHHQPRFEALKRKGEMHLFIQFRISNITQNWKSLEETENGEIICLIRHKKESFHHFFQKFGYELEWNKCSDRSMEVWLSSLLKRMAYRLSIRLTNRPTNVGYDGSKGSYTSINRIVSGKSWNIVICQCGKILGENYLILHETKNMKS